MANHINFCIVHISKIDIINFLQKTLCQTSGIFISRIFKKLSHTVHYHVDGKTEFQFHSQRSETSYKYTTNLQALLEPLSQSSRS